MEDQTTLYEGAVPILVRREQHEDRQMDLTIHISTTSKVSSSSPVIRYTPKFQHDHKFSLREEDENIDSGYSPPKNTGGFKSTVLCVRITDPNDPFFLFTLHLSEEEFKTIKSNQSLLVDFSMFPGKIIDLLQSCVKSHSEESPTFFAMLEIHQTESFFKVLENTAFRQLDHLSLQLRAGNDNAIKKYLASQLKFLKENKEKLEQQLSYTETSLKRKLDNVQKEAEELKEERDELLTAKEREVANIKEQFYSQQQENINKYERQKNYTEDSYRSQLHRVEERLENMEQENKELQDRKFQLESDNRELKSKINSLQNEIGLNKGELDKLREDNKTLDTTKFENEKNINQQKIKISVLEQKIKDQEELLVQKNDMLKELEIQKDSSNENIKMLKERSNKADEQLETTSKDLKKAHHIIQRLNQELKNQNSKLKHRKAMIKEQARSLSQYSDASKEMRQEAKQLKEQIEKRDQQISDLKNSLQESNEKIEDLIKQNEKQETVSASLHKQLTEYQRRLEQNEFRSYTTPKTSLSYQPGNYVSYRNTNAEYSSYSATNHQHPGLCSYATEPSMPNHSTYQDNKLSLLESQHGSGSYFPNNKSPQHEENKTSLTSLKPEDTNLSSFNHSFSENKYTHEQDNTDTNTAQNGGIETNSSTQPNFVY
eukprot:gb/GECH01000574.1/.p1 GENE.gb/GECH01000574.1/~~gb/GECH01000574.1/.p1  ORF type:complete len:658 (+),score=186.55 gb/GECH01000574.1/:1-1974(+)